MNKLVISFRRFLAIINKHITCKNDQNNCVYNSQDNISLNKQGSCINEQDDKKDDGKYGFKFHYRPLPIKESGNLIKRIISGKSTKREFNPINQ